ncbi:ectoine/hydroxyectoine ABC transporter substrate-binding protein EhuB [Halobacillus shinanisalinarum]|uniref:Ectoine/hydroxyectoine ABC transporter substrate-binding protein EhuB n=1 Tax=Halobacillus shinanisalinarum TaxID=2932258 RepID=A0ABY4GUV7_9BACI|nr:ectoine/hydroxyectoine ABC transporter substrate-binding protein EhuB [Halobacillus shinanisalinarum]UOQ91680.1 ectoine/hydroxyectoine ABC transporter substrate-binding protein EhuB [Halobacillus shinanisalinarum]
MKKKLLSMIIVTLSVLLLAACGSEESSGSGEGGDSALSKVKDQGYVTVGFANEAPYAYKEDGELKGVAVEIAKAAFAKMGVDEVKGEIADWKQLIPGVKTGKFDVITAGMAILPNRCEQVDFATPGIKYGEGMVVEKGNPESLKSYADIAANGDVTVAVMSGATEVDFLKSAGVSEDQIETYPDIAATLDAVKTGRAQATTATELTVKKAMKSTGGDSLEYVQDFEQPDVEGVPSYGAAGFAQDADDLREAYNEELAKMRESGELAEIVNSVEFFGDGNLITEDITVEELCKG